VEGGGVVNKKLRQSRSNAVLSCKLAHHLLTESPQDEGDTYARGTRGKVIFR